MKVLMLTWEFPPYIAGGLGMACYGLAKALLSKGVEIDMILPTSQDVYFPLRTPTDADILPVDYLDPSKRWYQSVQTKENLEERLRAAGISTRPESYISPAFNLESYYQLISNWQILTGRSYIDALRVFLRGNEPIFTKIQEMCVRIAKYAKTFNFDLIHAHDWLTYPPALILKNISGKKMISHIHATEFDRAGGPGDERIHNIEYSGLSSSDAVIAVSHYTEQIVVGRYKIDSKKIRVVHNAYSVSERTGPAKKRLFKDPLVLFLGRVTLQKGPDYFLNIAERVLKRFTNVRFIMAGSGDMFSKILKSSASKRLKDRFLVAGFLNREQVEKILSTTDIFVLPSVSEPFGIVPLEAMAFGAVAILSKQSGVSEVVNNVFKIDFWDIDKTVDTIVHLLENPQVRERYAKAGQAEAFAIGWQKAADEVFNIYRELQCFI